MTLEMERRPPCITTWAAISSFTLIREPMILEERERAREREGEGGQGRERERGGRGRERESEGERGRGEGEGGRESEGEGGRESEGERGSGREREGERERGEGEGRREVLEKLLFRRTHTHRTGTDSRVAMVVCTHVRAFSVKEALLLASIAWVR